MAKDYKPIKNPVLRFFLDSAGVFELICKIILAVIIIPYGSLFVNGLIFDKLLKVVDGNDFWVIAIVATLVILFILGNVVAVYAIVRYSIGIGRKRISTPKTKESEEK